MTHTFLVKIDTGDDTDLIGIAAELHAELLDQFDVQDVTPWTPHNLGASLTQPAVSAQQNNTTN